MLYTKYDEYEEIGTYFFITLTLDAKISIIRGRT